MKWINLLHLYQPANMEREKVLEATEKSYERILRALEEHPQLHFTLNIAGCLLKRWDEEFKRQDLIARYRKLVHAGQIELTGSAAYHALLPLVSQAEAAWQVDEQEKILHYYFGDKIKIKGFFPSELAINTSVLKLAARKKYQWIALDPAVAGDNFMSYSDSVFQLKNASLLGVFRNRDFSETYVPKTMATLINNNISESVVTISDAELYGLHYIDQSAEFEKVIKHRDLKTLTVSEYVQQSKLLPAITLRAGSWQSTVEQLAQAQPFLLWLDRNNRVHRQLWTLVRYAEKMMLKYQNDASLWWSRWHFVRGVASCVFWWASQHDFRQVLGPLAWNPEEVEKGVNELIRAVRTLEKSTTISEKLKAEKLAIVVKKTLWQTHWQLDVKS
ncbi:MAG: hypothetical protein WCK11_03035 [Candidatus Falkowbacteria bacterium]